MKIHLVLFHTKTAYNREGFYDESINRLINTFKDNGGDEVHIYTEETIPFDDDNVRNYFEQYKNNAFGFYAFKPLVILDTMSKIPDGDVVLYHDAGRPEYNFSFKKNLIPLVNTVIDHYQGIGLGEGDWNHNQLTKDKCFKLMDCDTQYIRQQKQLAANWGVYEKNLKSLSFLNEWKIWCLDHEVICTEEPEDINHNEFQSHRWDQSILTNLFYLYSLKTLPYVNYGWEKDINNFIGDYTIKVVNTFNSKEGLTLITDVFYKYDKFHILTTGAVKDIMLFHNGGFISPDKSIIDSHMNNHCFHFNVKYKECIKLKLDGVDGPIDNSNISFIVKKDYYDDYPDENIMSVICHTSINSLYSIKSFVEYHSNLGYDKIIVNENGGKKFIELYELLKEYIKSNKVVLKCYKNITFHQKYSKSSYGLTNAGETIHMNQSLHAYKTSKYMSAFNIDEFVVSPSKNKNITLYLDYLVDKYDLKDKGGISILSYDFAPPENNEPFYKSKRQILNMNQYNSLIFPKIIHFTNNIDAVTCHSITVGNQPFSLDKDILTYNHYPFIDNGRFLGDIVGEIDNIDCSLFDGSFETPSKEVVIALYNRDIDWINQLNSDVKVTIYRKGDLSFHPNEIFLSNNVGRDVHTFFYHIVTNYNNLSDYTFFSQDYPFDHIQNYVGVINGKKHDWTNISNHHFEGYWGLHWAEVMWPLQPATQFEGMVNVDDIKGRPHHWEDLPIEEYWNELFDHPCPENVEYTPGGHFGISKEQIQMRSISFYQRILDYLENEFLSPWIIERLEPYIFNSTIKAKI
jgi:hypothetical protein